MTGVSVVGATLAAVAPATREFINAMNALKNAAYIDEHREAEYRLDVALREVVLRFHPDTEGEKL